MNSKLNKYIKSIEYLRLDERSVAIFRIVLGISILYSLIILKLPYTVEFWGEHTIIPINILQKANGIGSWSIFDYVRKDGFAYFWMSVSIVLAVLFTIGWQTKIVSFLLLFFFFNILQAYTRYNTGFDKYTFQLLTWACFLPLSNFFSIKNNTQKIKTPLWVSVIVIVQIAMVYFITGLAKTGDAWKNGYAVQVLTSDLWMRYTTAEIFRDNAWLYMPLTYATLLLDYLFPFFLFIKFKNNVLRYFAIIYLLGFHISIFSLVDVANFSITGVAAAMIIIPSSFWEKLKIQQGFKFYSTIKSNSQKMMIYGFTIFVLYTIVQKNLLFYTRLDVYKTKHESIAYKFFNAINIPTVVQNSFQFQYWKMYAPSPASEGGWLSIEYKGEDGFLYDYFTKGLLSNTEHKISFRPKGMEAFLLFNGRSFKYEDRWYSAIFMRYWLSYQLKKNKIPVSSYNNYYLAVYSLDVSQQDADLSQVHKEIIPLDVLETFVKPYEQNLLKKNNEETN